MTVYDQGLEHVAVAETRLSRLDGEAGKLIVCGYPIEELAANATYEEGVFLLLHDRLPTADELATFRRNLADRREIDETVREVLRQAATEGRDPMDALRMGVAATSQSTTADVTSQVAALKLVAVVPTIVTTYWRYRQGKPPLDPRADLGHAANYYYMLIGEEPTDTALEGLETFLTTAIEHGLNASTFAARVVASTESDVVSAATAAVGALKGPQHGGELEAVASVLDDIRQTDDLERLVSETLETYGRIPGFGHRLYDGKDPRAAVLKEAVGDLDSTEYFRSVCDFEEHVTEEVAHELSGQRGANIAFHTATLLLEIGIPQSLLTPSFAVSRVAGWMAHYCEQLTEGRLVRPDSRYEGSTEQPWIPIEQRYAAGDAVVERPLRSQTLEPVSETLATLSEPNRLDILLALYDGDEPVSYSMLRAATDIDDKGKFNYHLRQLRGFFITEHTEGYALSEAGRTLVQTVVTDRQLLDRPE